MTATDDLSISIRMDLGDLENKLGHAGNLLGNFMKTVAADAGQGQAALGTLGATLGSLIDQFDPAAQAAAKLAQQFNHLAAASASWPPPGAADQTKALADSQEKVQATLARYEQQISRLNKVAGEQKGLSSTSRNLSGQVLELGSAIANGMPAGAAFLQQGEKILQMMLAEGVGFGEITASFAEMGGVLLRFAPATAVATAVAALTAMGVAAENTDRRLRGLQNHLRLSRADYGAMAGASEQAARQLAATTPISTNDARTVTGAIAANPFFVGGTEQIVKYGREVEDLAAVMDGDFAKASATFNAAVKNPLQTVRDLADQGLPGLNYQLIETVRHLEASGDRQGAFKAAWTAIAESVRGASDNLTPLQKEWDHFLGLFTDVKQSAIAKFFAGVGEGIRGLAELFLRVINTIIDGFNNGYNYLARKLGIEEKGGFAGAVGYYLGGNALTNFAHQAGILSGPSPQLPSAWDGWFSGDQDRPATNQSLMFDGRRRPITQGPATLPSAGRAPGVGGAALNNVKLPSAPDLTDAIAKAAAATGVDATLLQSLQKWEGRWKNGAWAESTVGSDPLKKEEPAVGPFQIKPSLARNMLKQAKEYQAVASLNLPGDLTEAQLKDKLNDPAIAATFAADFLRRGLITGGSARKGIERYVDGETLANAGGVSDQATNQANRVLQGYSGAADGFAPGLGATIRQAQDAVNADPNLLDIRRRQADEKIKKIQAQIDAVNLTGDSRETLLPALQQQLAEAKLARGNTLSPQQDMARSAVEELAPLAYPEGLQRDQTSLRLQFRQRARADNQAVDLQALGQADQSLQDRHAATFQIDIDQLNRTAKAAEAVSQAFDGTAYSIAVATDHQLAMTEAGKHFLPNSEELIKATLDYNAALSRQRTNGAVGQLQKDLATTSDEFALEDEEDRLRRFSLGDRARGLAVFQAKQTIRATGSNPDAPVYQPLLRQVGDNAAKKTEKKTNWKEGALSALDDYRDSAEAIGTQVQGVFSNAFKGMEDALVNFTMTGKLSFSDLANSIIGDIERIIIKAGLSQIFSWITGSLGGSEGGPGPAMGGPKMNAKGGVYASPSLSVYSGGVYDRPQLFAFAKGVGLFGEAGPEAIMPLMRGADGSLGVRAQLPELTVAALETPAFARQGSGAGGMVHAPVSLSVNVDASGQTRSQTSSGAAGASSASLGKALSQAVQAEIARQMRQGGALWRMKNGIA